jgi:hypothetical protein
MNSQIASGRNRITVKSKVDDDEEEYELDFSKRLPLDTYDQPEQIPVQDLLYQVRLFYFTSFIVSRASLFFNRRLVQMKM